MNIPLRGAQGIVKKRFLCKIVVLICLVITFSLYITTYGNSFHTLQEGRRRNGEGGPEKSANVRIIAQSTVPTIANSARGSPTADKGTGEGGSGMSTVRTMDQVTVSTTVNSARESPDKGNGEGGSEKSTVRTVDQTTVSTTVNSVRTFPNVVVYIEMFDWLNVVFGNSFTDIEKQSQKRCLLPNGSLCIYQHADNKADVVFRFVYNFIGGHFPYRYYDKQIVAMMNSEAESPEVMEPLAKADIQIDHHPSSDVTHTEACMIPWKAGIYKTPDPSKRKGICLFVSHCDVKWRTDYILELAKHIHIDSYGECWHNVSMPSNRKDRMTTGFDPAKKYRMLLTFENTINHDYISEKIAMGYNVGTIPVYWGPPEIYQWTPGNHTFIDAQRFKGPKELAEYLKRVDEDDDLFRYHTTNFNYSTARKTHLENCPPEPYWCQICTIAQKIKMSRGK